MENRIKTMVALAVLAVLGFGFKNVAFETVLNHVPPSAIADGECGTSGGSSGPKTLTSVA